MKKKSIFFTEWTVDETCALYNTEKDTLLVACSAIHSPVNNSLFFVKQGMFDRQCGTMYNPEKVIFFTEWTVDETFALYNPEKESLFVTWMMKKSIFFTEWTVDKTCALYNPEKESLFVVWIRLWR